LSFPDSNNLVSVVCPLFGTSARNATRSTSLSPTSSVKVKSAGTLGAGHLAMQKTGVLHDAQDENKKLCQKAIPRARKWWDQEIPSVSSSHPYQEDHQAEACFAGYNCRA